MKKLPAHGAGCHNGCSGVSCRNIKVCTLSEGMPPPQTVNPGILTISNCLSRDPFLKLKTTLCQLVYMSLVKLRSNTIHCLYSILTSCSYIVDSCLPIEYHAFINACNQSLSSEFIVSLAIQDFLQAGTHITFRLSITCRFSIGGYQFSSSF